MLSENRELNVLRVTPSIIVYLGCLVHDRTRIIGSLVRVSVPIKEESLTKKAS